MKAHASRGAWVGVNFLAFLTSPLWILPAMAVMLLTSKPERDRFLSGRHWIKG